MLTPVFNRALLCSSCTGSLFHTGGLYSIVRKLSAYCTHVIAQILEPRIVIVVTMIYTFSGNMRTHGIGENGFQRTRLNICIFMNEYMQQDKWRKLHGQCIDIKIP